MTYAWFDVTRNAGIAILIKYTRYHQWLIVIRRFDLGSVDTLLMMML